MSPYKLDIEYNEVITVSEPNFDHTSIMYKGISRYKDDYSFFLEGDSIKDLDHEYDLNSLELHRFKAGTKIALIENFDWNDNLSEFAGEIEFTKDAKAYYDENSSGTVVFKLGNKYIAFNGEYSPIEEQYRDEINKHFSTEYEVIFIR